MGLGDMIILGSLREARTGTRYLGTLALKLMMAVASRVLKGEVANIRGTVAEQRLPPGLYELVKSQQSVEARYFTRPSEDLDHSGASERLVKCVCGVYPARGCCP